MKYCIICERNVLTFRDFAGEWHLFCNGPFAYCPPPELLEDWELYAVEPDADEWMIMELSAKSLLLELDALV